MKKIICFSLILLALNLNGQQQKLILSGNISNTEMPTLLIFKFDNSFERTLKIDLSGNFKDTFAIPTPGYYFLKLAKNSFLVFLRNEYDLQIKIDASNFYKSISYNGNGASVNNYTLARNNLKASLVVDAKEFFVRPLEDFIKKIEYNKIAFTKLLDNTGLDVKDDQIMRKCIEYDYLLTRYNYRNFYFFNTKVEPVIPSDYYNPIRNMDMNDVEGFNNSMDYRYLLVDNWRLYEADVKKVDSNRSAISIVESLILPMKHEVLKDQIIRMLFNKVDSKNNQMEADYQKIKSMIVIEKSKADLEKRYIAAKTTGAGKEIISLASFNYENYNGGTTSLASLKGKYVYIDVWATWCGPCLRELPAYKQLITDYQGNNIEFLSISVDKMGDHAAWKKMVKEKKVGGIQLIADKDFDSDFMKFFNVSVIPRSILLDPNGNVVSSAGLRPSDEATKLMFDKIVVKK